MRLIMDCRALSKSPVAVAIGLKDIKCVSEVSLPLFPFAAEYARDFFFGVPTDRNLKECGQLVRSLPREISVCGRILTSPAVLVLARITNFRILLKHFRCILFSECRNPRSPSFSIIQGNYGSIRLELQILSCVIPVVCVTNEREGSVVNQHN